MIKWILILPGIESGDTNNDSQDNVTKRKLGI